ncbi:nitroreductase family protein [Aggregatilinea lenta]|uniref:nitroreductase family protein n=1 Tax=Aggregatilinea lenta TaxID=913108 RepID=UPI0013C3421A|nr:nitroreductase [Aggregatilinea lenta]
MDVSTAIKSNRSVRKFTDQPVPRDDIERIVNAGRLSGSAKNRQPWRFVVVTARDTLQALSECGPWCTHLAGAAFAVVMVVKDLTDPPTLTTPFDLGRASQNMILAAWDLGIGSCMATVYEPQRARVALGVPDDRAVPWAISFGYPHPDADPRNRPPRKEGRRSFDEVASSETWNENE